MTGRLLVCYSNSSNYVSTTAEYINSIAEYSRYDVHYIHVTNGAEIAFDLDKYDAIFQSYCARLPVEGYVSQDYLLKLKNFRGIKLLSVQDEYDRTNMLRQMIREIGYHTVFTCVPMTTIERVYPPKMFPKTEFITVLTGYLSQRLAQRPKVTRQLRDRPITIGYRGREIGARYGRLGFEKLEIGRRMREFCRVRGVPHDIEWSEDKRIYGEAWYDFIGSCRATLGSESGSNVFDFDGAIEAKYAELVAASGRPVPYEEFRTYTDPVEVTYDMGQISPRVFEAAALRTPMILFTGRYSGLIEPEEHYIELKKDFSNVDAVLSRLDDLDSLERMAERAYQRVVKADEFSYRGFVNLIDETIARQAKESGVSLRRARGHPAAADFSVDTIAATSLQEKPTAAPHPPAVFRYKQIARQNAVLVAEIARLNVEFSRLNEAHMAETTRLNEVYPAEIARLNAVILHLNEVYTAEIARLNEAYPAETSRLNAEIARLNEIYSAEIARLNTVILHLNEGYTAEIARLNEAYPAEITRLNADIARLNEVYPAEITRLNAEVARLNEVYPAQTTRLNAEVVHLNEEIARLSAEIERINQLVLARISSGYGKLAKLLFGLFDFRLSATSARCRKIFGKKTMPDT